LGHAVGGAGVPLVSGGPPGSRTYPSGGALYPIEVLVLALRVAGIASAYYRYQALGHRLVRVAPSPRRERLQTLFNDHPVHDAALAVLLVADLTRPSLAKYGGKSYRLLLLEAGHAAQNLLLVATALGLAGLPLCGFLDDELAAGCGLDPPRQVVAYAVALGFPCRRE
jgi:SagB-type dehydrogenase family enzyme